MNIRLGPALATTARLWLVAIGLCLIAPALALSAFISPALAQTAEAGAGGPYPDPLAAPVPETYRDAGQTLVQAYPAAAPVPVPVADFDRQLFQLQKITNQLNAWAENSQTVAVSAQTRLHALEEAVATLNAAIKALQNGQPAPAPGTDDGRLAALEARVAQLEADRGTVKAPFSVVDAAGQTLFSVAADGTVTVGTQGQSAIVMKAGAANSAFIQVAAGAKRLLMVAAEGDGTHVQLNDGPDAAVELTASGGNNGFIRVAGGQSAAILNVDPDNAATLNLDSGAEAGLLLSTKPESLGLLVQKGGQNAISLGGLPGKGLALRLFNAAGQQVVSAGPNPAKGDAGIVSVSAGGSAAAWLVSEADGNGLAQVFAADGTGAAAMVAAERAVVAYNAAGNPVATISKSGKSEGGTVVARNPDGEGIFAAGFAAESGGGEACVWRAKRSNTFCLGIGLPGMGVGK